MKTKFSSLLQFLKEISSDYKYMLPLMFLLAIFQGLAPLINIVLPKYILDELLTMKRLNILTIYITPNFFAESSISVFTIRTAKR